MPRRRTYWYDWFGPIMFGVWCFAWAGAIAGLVLVALLDTRLGILDQQTAVVASVTLALVAGVWGLWSGFDDLLESRNSAPDSR